MVRRSIYFGSDQGTRFCAEECVNKVRDEHLWKDWYFMKREVFLKYRKRKWQMLLIYFQIRNLVNYWLLWSAEWWRILIEWIRSLRQGEYQEEFGDSEEYERPGEYAEDIRIDKWLETDGIRLWERWLESVEGVRAVEIWRWSESLF